MFEVGESNTWIISYLKSLNN